MYTFINSYIYSNYLTLPLILTYALTLYLRT